MCERHYTNYNVLRRWVYDYFVKKVAKKWIRQEKPAPPSVSNPFIEYLYTALIRFVNIHTKKDVVRETSRLSRSRSCNNIPFDVPCSGVKCSGWIAKYINPDVPLTSGNKIVSNAWAYSTIPYAQFTKDLLNIPYADLRPSYRVELSRHHPAPEISIEHCVAVQFILFDERRDFHTFCAFRHGLSEDGTPAWFIGDNMPGIASRCPALSVQTIRDSTIQYDTTLVPPTDRLHPHTFTFHYRMYDSTNIFRQTYSKSETVMVTHSAYPGHYIEDKSYRIYYYAVPLAGGRRNKTIRRKSKSH